MSESRDCCQVARGRCAVDRCKAQWRNAWREFFMTNRRLKKKRPSYVLGLKGSIFGQLHGRWDHNKCWQILNTVKLKWVIQNQRREISFLHNNASPPPVIGYHVQIIGQNIHPSYIPDLAHLHYSQICKQDSRCTTCRIWYVFYILISQITSFTNTSFRFL